MYGGDIRSFKINKIHSCMLVVETNHVHSQIVVVTSIVSFLCVLAIPKRFLFLLYIFTSSLSNFYMLFISIDQLNYRVAVLERSIL
jgi:hypothetical protein